MVYAMTVIGFLLRLVGANQSFWLDEGASIEIALTPLVSFVEKMATDFHPPLFYLLLKLWLPFAGKSELLIRLPFILLATASIPALYFLIKETTQVKNQLAQRVGLILLAISPFHIYYSQELRMYSLSTLLTVLSWLYLIRYQKRSGGRNIFLFGLFGVLNLYTFYGAFFNLVAQAIYIVCRKNKVLILLSALAVTVFMFLPWIPILREQLAAGGYLKTALPGWQSLSGTLTLKSLLLIPLKLIFGRVSFSPKMIYFAMAGFTSLIYLMIAVIGSQDKKSRPFTLWLFVPLIIASVISFKTPVLGYWRFLFILPALISLVSIGFSRLSLPIRGVVFWTTVVITLIPTVIYWTVSSNQREDWRGLSKFTDQQNSLVIVNFPYTFAPLKFYSSNSSYFFTQQSLGQAKSDLIPELSVSAKGKTKIYLLDYLSDLTDPQRSVRRMMENSGYITVTTKSFNNLGTVTEFSHPGL